LNGRNGENKMKKIAILSAVNIKHMSLISLYTDILKEKGIEYDIIYMDKYNEDEYFECAHKYRYVNPVNQKWLRLLKKLKYMTFYPYAAKILKKNQYDLIIVWNDVAIFMFAGLLPRKYKGRYCLNVRDNMWYDKKRFQKRYEKCFLNSVFNTISSEGFLEFLPPKATYLPIQSLNLSALEGMKIHDRMRTEGEPIKIGFVGCVRFYERNQKLLDAFANDSRFELHYYGKNANVLKKYADEKKIENTRFHDSFPVEDTAQYLEQVDVMNNLYGNGTLNIRLAISIKFYHALYSRIPILVSPNTYIGKLAKDIGVGFEIGDEKIDETLADRFYEWYRNVSFETIAKASEEMIKKAYEDNARFKETVIRFLSEC